MRCLIKSHLTHDGKTYEPGQTVELTEAQAAAMPWAVEAAPAEEKAASVKAQESPAKKGK